MTLEMKILYRVKQRGYDAYDNPHSIEELTGAFRFPGLRGVEETIRQLLRKGDLMTLTEVYGDWPEAPRLETVSRSEWDTRVVLTSQGDIRCTHGF